MSQPAQQIPSEPTLFLKALSIVFRGSLNPMIFHPIWFVHEGLIRKDEGEDAKTEIVHQQISVISTKWFRLQVETDRFVATTTQEHQFDALRDLVMGTFRVLHHTPVNQMGINLEVHYQMPSTEAWHAIGDKLAPKESWAAFVKKPGLASLIMNTNRTDDRKGYINVRVEPSKTVNPGVFIEVNDHIEVTSEAETVHNADQMLTVLENTWKTSLDRSHQIVRGIMEIQ